mgnify:CR=1 FL=1
MKINSRAWHLTLVRWLAPRYQPTNLCSYFWLVLGSLLLAAVGIALVIILLPIIPIILLIKHLATHHPLRQQSQEASKPSLLLEFLKAKKRKLCPLITVVEE